MHGTLRTHIIIFADDDHPAPPYDASWTSAVSWPND